MITVVFSLATSQLLYSLAEVYLFSHPLPFLTLNVDVYSSLDDGQIQCPSLFPELWCSGSCPLYLVRLSGRFSSVMCIRRSSSHGWKHDQKHCFSLCVVCPILLRYRTLIHLLFQLVCSLDILVSSGGDHSNPRTEFAADTSTLWKVLHGSSGAFFLPKLSHRQQVDNGLQGSVDFHASFRAYLRHHEAETRRRSCCPHG